MKRFLRWLLMLPLLIILSCSFKPRGWWDEGMIAVMASIEDWEAMQGTIGPVFERVVRTPQIETTFRLRLVPEKEFDRYSEYRYIIMMATLESKGRVADLVKGVVSDPVIRQSVESGDHFIFTQRNQWAKDQIMAILVAKDMQTLKQKIASNEDFLYAIFDTDVNYRIKKYMYEHKEQKEVSRTLMSRYGWTLRLPHDYFIAQELADENMIWFRRRFPERWLFVRWIAGGDTTLLDPYWVVGERNRIGAVYYGGDEVVTKYLYSQPTTFLGRKALITTGLWENDEKVAGGPFKNYTFYDPLSRRVYMIDVAVFAPDREKAPYLRRMDIMARTFRTVFEREEEE